MLRKSVTAVILFVLSVFVHGVHNLVYSDLEFLGVHCEDRDKCDGYMNNLTYTERSCECDSSCNTYNDCCIDATGRISDGVRNGPKNGMRCIHYGREDHHTGVYVIANCSNTWNGSIQLRRKCEDEIDLGDPLIAVPVVSVSQGFAYRNRYCAECNDADMENLTAFQIKLSCGTLVLSKEQVLADLTYDYGLRSWGINRFNTFENATDFILCKILFDVPGYLNSSVRFCRSNIISTCPPDYTREVIRRGCDDSYMAVVYDGEYAYKNPHCAICNNRTLDLVACEDEFIGRNRPFFSITLVMDINLNDGDEVGRVIVPHSDCPPDHIYDPFSKRCRRLVCALPGYEVVDGICTLR